MNIDNKYSSPEVIEEWNVHKVYRGINYGCSFDYQRDMFNIHKLSTERALKECIDQYIDHGITHRIIHSLDPFFQPNMLMQWEVHGDKLITKMSVL